MTEGRLGTTKKQTSIRRQILVWFLALSIVPLIVVSVVSYLESTRNLRSAAQARIGLAALDKERQIKSWFDSRFKGLEEQVRDPENRHLINRLSQGYKASGLPVKDYVLTPEWRGLVKGKQDSWKATLETYEYVHDLLLIDGKGNILLTSAGEPDLGANISDPLLRDTRFAATFAKAMATGKPLFSDLELYGPSGYELTGFLIAPIIQNGERLGAIASQIKQNHLQNLLAADKVDGLIHFLVGEDGLLRSALSGNTEEVLQRSVDTEQFRLWYAEHALPGNEPDTQHEKTFEYTGPEGDRVLGSHHTLRIRNVTWVLMSEMSLDTAMASARWMGKVVFALAVTTLLIVILFAFKLANRITRPLMELMAITDKITRGDLDQRVNIESRNEIGRLGDAFNRMLETRREHEKRIRENQAQLALVIDSTAVGIWDWYVQTGEASFNERWAEIIGYSLKDLEPTSIETWMAFAHPDDLEESGRKLQEHWDGKTEHYVCEARMKHKKGHWVWVLDTGKVVEWYEDGRPKRMIGTHLDITERKASEKALLDAKEEAEAAVRAKSEFLASMSHEIRTPMNGVLGMLGLLVRGSLSKDQAHQARLALSSAESLLTLINDILDFSKVEAGKLDLELLDFNLVTMLGDFADFMGHRAQEKHLELIIDTAAIKKPMIKGDPGRIRQILSNLVGNAIKFTREGEIIIRAWLETQPDNRLQLFCSVKDTGIGIAEDKQDVIFDTFTQVDASTTRQYGGTGLGLSIVKKLCELMGGSVSVASQAGEGSEFTFNLLVDASEVSQPEVLPQTDVAGVRVLVVDDNATNCEVLKAQLSLWGMHVVVARTGDQALTLLEQASRGEEPEPFRVAFLDYQMPGMDGYELAGKIREDDRWEDLKLVMMTSVTNRGDAEYFAGAGFQAYFPKPVTMNDLHDALMVVLNEGEVLERAQPLVTRHYLHSLHRQQPGQAGQGNYRIPWPHNARVLMAEDNPINQEVARGILEDIGLTCDAVFNGKEALQALINARETQPYTLILMDCQMPEMDGFAATRAIREGQAGDAYRSVPIIAMTANAMKGDRERCLAAGMNDYLSKPVDGDELERALARWLLKVSESPQEVKNGNDKPSLRTWHRESALKRCRGKEERLKILVDMYCQDMPDRIRLLRQCVKSADYEELEKLAHAIKGITANLSAEKLAALASELELKAREQDSAVARLVIRLEREHQAVITAFNGLTGSSGTS